MKKRYLLGIVAICLSATLVVILGLFLTAEAATSWASRVESTADTPDLVINVEAGEESVLASEIISWMLWYTNTLGQPVENVIITSTLSKQQYYTPATYLSAPIIPTTHFTYSGNYYEGYLLRWQLGSLPAGIAGWIVITTTLPPEAEPPWNDNNKWPLLGMSAVISTSTAEVSVGNPEGIPGDSASVEVVGPVLKITKEDNPGEVRPGKLLTYTLSVENKDREDVVAAHNLVITDSLPENTLFEHASGTGTFSPTSPTGGLIIWHPLDPLERDSTTEVSFTVRLTESMPACPPDKIINENYSVSAEETIQIVTGKKQSTNVDDVLEKTIQTPDPPSGDKAVFPGDIVTYTISIYNPRHDQPVTGIRLTDTLPGEPNLFTFVDMVDDGPMPSITYPQVAWDIPSISAGEVYTFSFNAWVPYHIYIDANETSRTYKNNLSASVPGLVICDMKDQTPSEAKVTRQIELDKDVEPDHVLSGNIVVYTITLENVGDTTITDIRLTDTLPANFYYVGMVNGPEPEPEYQYNPVVWDDLGVAGNDETSLSFEAMAVGWPECYNNHLSASSPWTTIPDRTKEARLCIDPPFAVSKTVYPGETFVETIVYYEVLICNISEDTYTIDQFKDYLPSGFYAAETNPYRVNISPPEVLVPQECWQHGFDVDVTYDVGCGNLPRTYNNDLEFHIVDVGDFFVIDIAPLRVLPHVTIDKDANHKAVVPGETFIYTINLDNASSVQINNVTIEDTLPNSFEYVEMVAGDAPTDDTEPTIVWQDQTIPSQSQLVLVFRVQVPENMPLGKYSNEVNASTPALVCIKGSGDTARVEVVDEIIELEKKATPDEVPPGGTVHYEIQLKNKDSVPINNVTVIDTLPSNLDQDFEFITMTASYDDPAPSEIDGRQVIWSDLTVPGDKTLKLRFDARAALLFGAYDNQLSASCPRSPITPEEEKVEATVDVLPGVILYKTASPTQTISGHTVVYVVTLDNQSDDILVDVRITDTLPAGFSYRRTLDGPLPVQLSPLVWELSQLNKKESQEFIFEVKVGFDVITGTYPNQIRASSPSALIPNPGETALVDVRSLGDLGSVYLPLVLRSYKR
jgi:uncharacterized repeat protein (TIGR01451 family)